MRCEDVRLLLLEVDEDALRGGESEFSEHLRSCSGCAAIAGELRNGLAMLRQEFLSAAPARSVNETMDAVLSRASVAESTGLPVTGTAAGARGGADVRILWRRSSPLLWAAAAGVALLIGVSAASLLVQSGRDNSGDLSAPIAEPPPFTFSIPQDQSAVVFQTRNPDITVVWFISGD
jgi:hypothetical protein